MIKNILLASIFSFVSIATISAQDISVGARAGMMWHNVVSKDLSSALTFNTVSTPSYGLVANIGLTDNIAFHTELNYTEKGFKTNIGKDLTLFGLSLPVGAKATTIVKYVDMPLAIKYKFGNTEGVHFYAMGGANLGYAVSGDISSSVKLLIDINVNKTAINMTSSNYQRFEVGGIAGVGMNVPVGNGNFYIDARYNRSFQDVYEVPIVGAKVRNQGFGIGLGYLMNLDGGSSKVKHR
jgi:Outer membrane protein beta-barrel domain